MAEAIGALGTHRPVPVDLEPGTGLGRTLALLDEIDRTGRRLRPVLHMVEQVTGLSPAQLVGLVTVAEPDARDGATTDVRRAMLEQVQGLRIRIVDALLAALDEEDVDDLQVSLHRLAMALEHLSDRAHAMIDGQPPAPDAQARDQTRGP